MNLDLDERANGRVPPAADELEHRRDRPAVVDLRPGDDADTDEGMPALEPEEPRRPEPFACRKKRMNAAPSRSKAPRLCESSA